MGLSDSKGLGEQNAPSLSFSLFFSLYIFSLFFGKVELISSHFLAQDDFLCG
jgi:hypothetical protein